MTPRSAAALRSPKHSWRTQEHWMLGMFVMGRVWLFLTHLGLPVGYDLNGHLQAIWAIRWLHPFLPLTSFYYAYHPPLGFLLAHTFMLMGLPIVASAQLVSFCASFVGFFALRALLQHLKLLDTAHGIAFLYIVSAIPIQTYLVVFVNLDALILALACVTLLFSAKLFWNERPLNAREEWRYGLLLLFTLILSMWCKYSGVLLLTIPLLVALTERSWKGLRLAFVICVVAFCAIIPYHVQRYYIPTGEWFYNSAGHTFDISELRHSRMLRDRNPVQYVTRLVLPRQNPVTHAWVMPQLSVTWDGFWWAEDRAPESIAARILGSLYRLSAAELIILGLYAFGLLYKRERAFWKLGAVLLPFTVLQVLSMMAYTYHFPIVGYFTSKSIYIAPAVLGLGYLIACNMALLNLLPPRWKNWLPAMQSSLLLLLCFLLTLNQLLPVY